MLTIFFLLQYLDQGQSLFRLSWTIEEDLIREHLNLVTHPAFIPFSQEFTDKYAAEHSTSRNEVWKDLTDEVRLFFKICNPLE